MYIIYVYLVNKLFFNPPKKIPTNFPKIQFLFEKMLNALNSHKNGMILPIRISSPDFCWHLSDTGLVSSQFALFKLIQLLRRAPACSRALQPAVDGGLEQMPQGLMTHSHNPEFTCVPSAHNV